MCLHPSVSLNDEQNCREISIDKIAVCEKTTGLRSGKSSDLNSACLKALVTVEIFQFSDMHYETRFLDTFPGHNIRPNKHVNPKVIFVRIKCSKTDQFRQGYTIRLGIAGKDICAVWALLHRLRRGGAGPLFCHSTGSPLMRATLTTWLRNAVARAGLQGNFSGHSFPIRAATSAAAAGIPDHLIKTLGRWFSNAYQLYIQTPNHIIETAPARIVCNKNSNNNTT